MHTKRHVCFEKQRMVHGRTMHYCIHYRANRLTAKLTSNSSAKASHSSRSFVSTSSFVDCSGNSMDDMNRDCLLPPPPPPFDNALVVLVFVAKYPTSIAASSRPRGALPRCRGCWVDKTSRSPAGVTRVLSSPSVRSRQPEWTNRCKAVSSIHGQQWTCKTCREGAYWTRDGIV